MNWGVPTSALTLCAVLAGIEAGPAMAGGTEPLQTTRFILAQSAAPSRALGGPPPFRRATAKPEGMIVEIEEFLERLVGTYQNAGSYRDHGRVKLVQQSGRVRTTVESPLELTFQRPNRLRLDGGQYLVACDGQTLTSAASELRQYAMTKAPARLEKKHLQAGSMMGGADEGHPELIDFLIQPEAYATLVSQLARIRWAKDAQIEGVHCRVLEYETIHGTKVVNYVDPKRMILLRVEAQTLDAAPGGPGAAPPPTGTTTVVYELTPVELEPKLDPASFTYKPAAGFRRVRQLGAGTGPMGDVNSAGPEPTESEGAHLIGKPAPSVTGKDLAGTPVTVVFEDRVTLLFFWSLTGGEHSLTSIPVVQQVAEHFSERSKVQVIGISGDPGQSEVVSQLMTHKKAAFRTLLDDEHKLALAYRLGGFPTFAVIGPDGKVTWARLGAPPSLKEDLIREIQKCVTDSGKR